MAEWRFPHISDPHVSSVISIDIYDRSWGECVPVYVLQYIASAMMSYKQNMNATVVALLSIATEATLRDILKTKGYSFDPGASAVEIYEFAKADVGIDGHRYVIVFKQPNAEINGRFLDFYGRRFYSRSRSSANENC